MSQRRSAGLIIFRRRPGRTEFFLVHPGGPFWAKKDLAAWSIPKGEFEAGEDPLSAALREFTEETGFAPPEGRLFPLDPVRQPGGKWVQAWGVEGDLDPAKIKSAQFLLEWPPKSGQRREFPEVDHAGWFGRDEALTKILKGQRSLIEQLMAKLEGR